MTLDAAVKVGQRRCSITEVKINPNSDRVSSHYARCACMAAKTPASAAVMDVKRPSYSLTSI